MHPVKLIGRAADTAVHAVGHPLASAAYAAGIARGLAGAVRHGTEDLDRRPDTGPVEVPRQRTGTPGEAPAGPRKPRRVLKPVPPPDAEFDTVVIVPDDGDPGESFATEPKAVSRDSAHGGTPVNDSEIDAWIDEAMARGGDTAAGERERQQPDATPLLDPSVAKAIRSESDMLRKGAEVDPG